MSQTQTAPAQQDPIRRQFADSAQIEPDVCYLLTIAAGFAVGVYWGNRRLFAPGLKTGGDNVYQVMRDSERPGRGYWFWSWYVREMPQWFATPTEAAATFLENWRLWLAAGKTPN